LARQEFSAWNNKGVTRAHFAPVLLLLASVAGFSAVVIPPRASTLPEIAPKISGRTVHGKKVKLTGPGVTAVIFTGATCPIAKKLGPSLARLESEFADRAVRFVFVNPTSVETDAEVKAMITSIGLKGDYIRDSNMAVAKALKATTTSEAFVVDAAGKIRYRGAVHDQYAIGASKPNPTKFYLRDALNAVLSGKEPKVTRTDAPGCVLDVSAPMAKIEPITYHGRIAEIIAKNCGDCHRDGGVAPFRLDSFAAVKDRSTMIKYVVDQKMMPPWFAAETIPSPWLNDRSMPKSERDELFRWMSEGMPEGKMSAAAQPTKVHTGWEIGKPDAVYGMERAISIPAEGVMNYQNVTIPLDFDDERWVSGIEVQPGDRSVVHHVLVFIVPKTGRRPNLDFVGINGFFGGYVPGNAAMIYPAGTAKRIPANSNLRFQLHYTPNGKATKDLTKIALKFTTKPQHEVRSAGIANLFFRIPPNEPAHKVSAFVNIPDDAKLLSFLPHMHVRGKACRYDLVKADGTKELLLNVPKYDFNWQLNYRFREPRQLRKGEKLEYTAWFDNSSSNKSNPNPNRSVGWGEQTFDEMHLGYLEYYFDNENTSARITVNLANPSDRPDSN
jgi:thiol-disulfide isomerase/thioredoxin